MRIRAPSSVLILCYYIYFYVVTYYLLICLWVQRYIYFWNNTNVFGKYFLLKRFNVLYVVLQHHCKNFILTFAITRCNRAFLPHRGKVCLFLQKESVCVKRWKVLVFNPVVCRVFFCFHIPTIFWFTYYYIFWKWVLFLPQNGYPFFLWIVWRWNFKGH